MFFVVAFHIPLFLTFLFANSWLLLSEMTQDFGRFGITHHARFLALILIAVSVLYIAGAKDIT
jgi:hypothetical protein